MSKTPLKKRYLLKNAQEVIAFLAMASASIKKNITSLYLDTHSTLGVIAFSFTHPKEALACEAALVESILEDVSLDKRYKRRYLELFGFVQQYDFDVSTVFERLDKLPIHSNFEISFHGGMSTQKVLKVLLYQALLRLEYTTTEFLTRQESPREALQNSFESIAHLLELWMYVFDKATLKKTHERLNALSEMAHEEAYETVVALIKTRNYRWVLLDLSCMLFEESSFYATHDMPILFFVRKQLKKKPSKLLKKLKKSLYM